MSTKNEKKSMILQIEIEFTLEKKEKENEKKKLQWECTYIKKKGNDRSER